MKEKLSLIISSVLREEKNKWQINQDLFLLPFQNKILALL